jgi:beta-glucanase (GH16 family)
MKKIFVFILLFFPILAHSQLLAENQTKVKKLIWSDEFEKEGSPDETKWNSEIGKARSNNEPQYHTSDLKNVRVSDGKLIITTLLEEVEGTKRYTSARINTRGKYEFTYGRVEVRAKLPRGRGIWPAIWTLGLTGGWPACGEIDIMEYWGHDPNIVAANLHTRDYNHTKGTGRGGKITYPDPFADFHIYAVEWHKDRMDFYLDDQMYFSAESKGEGIGEWPFFAPQYLILNQALWVNFREGQPGIDDTIFPQEFIIDYVRVYDLN